MILDTDLGRLPVSADECQGRVTLGIPDHAVTLSALGSGGERLAQLVAAKRSQAKGGDDRLGCAYLIGDLGWQVGHFFGGLWLTGWHVAHADPDAVAVTIRPVAWQDGGESGIAQVLDLHLDPGRLSAGTDTHGCLAANIVSLHQGVIAALARSTGLGQAAQWRLVSDGLSGALLEQGKSLGQVARAMTLGRAILGDKTTRLHSRQTEYVEIILPGETATAPPRARDWFRLRGGCSRYYTSADGDYCTTCVMRDRDDQIARLVAYVAQSNSVD